MYAKKTNKHIENLNVISNFPGKLNIPKRIQQRLFSSCLNISHFTEEIGNRRPIPTPMKAPGLQTIPREIYQSSKSV